MHRDHTHISCSASRPMTPRPYVAARCIQLTPNTQVLDVKKKIHETQTFPVENQKLIYSGMPLLDIH